MIRKLIVIFIVFWGLSSCSPLVSVEQADITNTFTLSRNNPLGQTFVARYDGLQAIRIFLEPDLSKNNILTLRLRSDQSGNSDLRTTSLTLKASTPPAYYTFRFDPIQRSSNRSYTLDLETESGINVAAAAGSTYIDGSLYQNSIPTDGQLAFKLVYDRSAALTGLGSEVLRWGGILGIGFFVYIIPGWALLSLLLPGWRHLQWLEKFALSGGISLSIYPILMLWTDLIGLHLGGMYAWIPCIAGALALIWRNWRRFRNPPNSTQFWKSVLSNLFHTEILFSLASVFLLVIVVSSRFWMIRPLAAPIGSDSYHHSLIVQLLHDHNGLFTNWLPYADLLSFTYHYGFHAAVAVFRWVYPLPAYEAVLWVGQIFNVMAVLVVYPFALRIVRARWVGIAAIWFAALVSPLPNVYLDWGRYTQLAGNIVMPTMIILAWTVLEEQEINWRPIVLTIIAATGLALTHYRVFLMSIFFFPAFLLIRLPNEKTGRHVLKLLWMGLGTGLLILPWLIRGFSGNLFEFIAHFLTTPPESTSNLTRQLESINDLANYLPDWAWLVMALAILWGIWKRYQPTVILCIWWLLALLATNPGWFGLPGAGIISNKIIFLAIYIPAGILIGSMIHWIMESLLSLSGKRIYHLGLNLLGILALLSSSIGFAKARIRDLTPDQITLTRADLRAATWIQANTPDSARFLVNSHFFFEDWPLGSDGGHWLPLIAHRRTTLPPMIYSAEREPRPGYYEQVLHLPLEIQTKGISHPEVLSLLREQGVSHIYIGQAPGPLVEDPYKMQIEQLLSDPHFRPVYHQDRVWVFAMVYQ